MPDFSCRSASFEGIWHLGDVVPRGHPSISVLFPLPPTFSCRANRGEGRGAVLHPPGLGAHRGVHPGADGGAVRDPHPNPLQDPDIGPGRGLSEGGLGASEGRVCGVRPQQDTCG